MQDIQTTGGVFTEESRQIVVSNICRVFSCREEDIEELVPVQAGMTNVVLSFRLKGGKYIYRHPGLGSDALVDRGEDGVPAWDVPPIITYMVREAGLTPDEAYRTFNMGVGMAIICDPNDVDDVCEALEAEGLAPFQMGEVIPGTGKVQYR